MSNSSRPVHAEHPEYVLAEAHAYRAYASDCRELGSTAEADAYDRDAAYLEGTAYGLKFRNLENRWIR